MTIGELNGKDREAFVDAIGWVFEASSWVAERAWPQRPFDTVESLQRALVANVASATREEQLALIKAHPDLGTRAAMSQVSIAEQQGAGLDRLTPAELTTLTGLNAEYRAKFGFPFIYGVKGSTKQDILSALESRLPATHEAEFSEALRQVYRIAQFRLEQIFGQP
jgi:2-oxo-4-hydroxy-4-carboxy-5-ureidoimidazoline decarboxylase